MVELPSYGMLYESCYNFIQVNGCTGKMGKAIITAADSAGISVAPVSFGSEEENGTNVEVCGKEITVHGPSGRESILSTLFDERPNLIVVDYTVPAAVNGMENRIFFLIFFLFVAKEALSGNETFDQIERVSFLNVWHLRSH